MADETTEGTNSKSVVLERAKERFQEATDGWQENYQAFRDDVAMLSGDAQWDPRDRAQRATHFRPCLTFNREPAYVDQVVGDARQQRPQIKVTATSVAGLEKGRTLGEKPKDISLAEVMNGLVRQIQRASFANIAYDTAIEHAAGHGLGWLRVVKVYSEADPFVHELRIQRIANWESALIDPFITDPTGADARYGFVWDWLPEDEYEAEYGEHDKADWDTLTADWRNNTDGVRVCEYFERTKVTRIVARLSDDRIVWGKDLAGIQDELQDQGITIVESKDAPTWEVNWYKLSGLEVLEGPVPVECTWIPLVPVFGKELYVNGKPRYRGVVRHSHDAQRAYNYAKTTAIERVAMTPKAPTRMTPEQLGNHKAMWESNRPRKYVLYDDVPGVPPPQDPPIVDTDAGAMLMAEGALDDLRGTTGVHEASLGEREGQESGRAIQALQRKGDLGTFAYIDNLSRSMAQIGRILVHWAPPVYDTRRVISILHEDESESYVMLRQEVFDEETGETRVVLDLQATAYDVTVTVGPSYHTLRAEAAEGMTTMVQAVPSLLEIAGDVMFKNLDWPGAGEIGERLHRVIPPKLLGEEEQQEPAPPTPDQQVAMAEAEAKMAQAEANGKKAMATAAEAELKIRELEAQLAQLPENINAMVEQAIMALLAQPVPAEMGGNGVPVA